MNNRIFNVNGTGDDLLLKTLELALMQEWGKPKTLDAWKIDKEKGLILYWHTVENTNPFPSPLNAQQLLPVVSGFLASEEAKQIICNKWDADCQHDGSNSLGWRVYCEDWGHIGRDHYAFIAIKPAYMWYGK